MELILKRGLSTGISIPGDLYVGQTHAAFTLEREDVAIPTGRYQIELYDSPHFGRPMPRLVDVPDRADIEIHWGNYPWNSDGCILVGEEQSPDRIWHTQDEFKILFDIIEQAVKLEGCWITIE